MKHDDLSIILYCQQGKRALNERQIEELYGDGRYVPHDDILRMRPLNDMFAMAEACLIADAIDILELKKDSYGEEYSATAAIDDVQAAVREIHVSGLLHSHIINAPAKYISVTPQVKELFCLLKSSGKQLFLCTNRYNEIL